MHLVGVHNPHDNVHQVAEYVQVAAHELEPDHRGELRIEKRLYHVADEVFDWVSVLGDEGEGGVVLVVLLMDVLIEEGDVEKAVRKKEEDVLHIKQEHYGQEILSTWLVHRYIVGKFSNRISVFSEERYIPIGKYTRWASSKCPMVRSFKLSQPGRFQCQGRLPWLNNDIPRLHSYPAMWAVPDREVGRTGSTLWLWLCVQYNLQ